MINQDDVILKENDIKEILDRMTFSIMEKHKQTYKLCLIGIHTRGVYIAQRIKKKFESSGIELQIGEIDITLYRDDWTRISHNPTVQSTNIPFTVDEKNIILVDDVLYTGRTIRAAMDAVMDFGRPDSIELAVLIDRGHRELPIQANYVGKTIETKRTETINVFIIEHDALDVVFKLDNTRLSK